MGNDVVSVKEPLERRIKADCNSCNTLEADFDYVGVNTPVLESGLGVDFFEKKYGKGISFLYICLTCNSSKTLASLKPYPVTPSE